MKYNIFLIRHGQTYYNIMHKMQGWSNSPLTTQGYEDAELVGDKLKNIKFNAAYNSDLSRAVETSEIILHRNVSNSVKRPIILKELRDSFYGSFEGIDINYTWKTVGQKHGYTTFKEIVTNHSIATAKNWLSDSDPLKLAESNQVYWDRLNKGIDKIRDSNLPENSNILWVSHGMTCLSIAEKFGKNLDVTKRPANGSISKLILTDDNLSFEYYDKT